MVLRTERSKAPYLRFAQPEQITHITAPSLWRSDSDVKSKINGSDPKLWAYKTKTDGWRQGGPWSAPQRMAALSPMQPSGSSAAFDTLGGESPFAENRSNDVSTKNAAVRNSGPTSKGWMSQIEKHRLICEQVAWRIN